MKDEGGKLIGGFRVLPHMQNPMGVCHGGLIASVFDVYLSLAAMYEGDITGLILPTVSLSLDFLAPTPGGAWVEARAQLLRAGRSLAFVQGLMTVEGRITVRANGVFNVPGLDTAADPPTTLEGLQRLVGGA